MLGVRPDWPEMLKVVSVDTIYTAERLIFRIRLDAYYVGTCVKIEIFVQSIQVNGVCRVYEMKDV